MFKPGDMVTVSDSSWSAVVNKETGAISSGELLGQEFRLLGVLTVPLPTSNRVGSMQASRPNNSILVNANGEVVFTHEKYLRKIDD